MSRWPRSNTCALCVQKGARPGERCGEQWTCMTETSPYPPIGDYAFISDCRSGALVSRSGSIDWCCMPRIDTGSCFGRLLGWENGGYCSITPRGEWSSSRRYVEDTLVLETTFHTENGEVRLFDCFALRADGEQYPYSQLIRVVEGVRGHAELVIRALLRFDYGEVRPWLRQEGVRVYSAIGGNDGLLVSSDAEISLVGNHDLEATVSVRAGERVRLSIMAVPPELLDFDPPRTIRLRGAGSPTGGDARMVAPVGCAGRAQGPE